MFAYCNNNPACFSDSTGKALRSSIVICSDKAPSRLHSPKSSQLKKEAFRIKQNLATPESWGGLSTNEKREAVTTYFNCLQDLLGIDNYSLTFDTASRDISDTYGMCIEVDTSIWINDRIDYLNNYDILATVAHECYHAYQNNALVGLTAEDSFVVAAWKADDSAVMAGGPRNEYEYYWGVKEQGARWFERDPYETIVALYSP